MRVAGPALTLPANSTLILSHGIRVESPKFVRKQLGLSIRSVTGPAAAMAETIREMFRNAAAADEPFMKIMDDVGDRELCAPHPSA